MPLKEITIKDVNQRKRIHYVTLESQNPQDEQGKIQVRNRVLQIYNQLVQPDRPAKALFSIDGTAGSVIELNWNEELD